MKPNHHPDDATLLSYAAGGLPGDARVLIDCHLQACPHCRQTILDAESIGGALLETAAPRPAADRMRNDMLARLEGVPPDTVPGPTTGTTAQGALPGPLQRLLGDDLEQLKWSPLVPGVSQHRIDFPDGNMRLLNISPGTCLPNHSHRGSELTLVLKGSYSDEIGQFCAGDVADLDPDVEHQPIVDSSEPCISLVVLDAPLKFRGIVPRLLQPFFGI